MVRDASCKRDNCGRCAEEGVWCRMDKGHARPTPSAPSRVKRTVTMSTQLSGPAERGASESMPSSLTLSLVFGGLVSPSV